MSVDHFSPVSSQYAAFRPSYPQALFDWLAGIAPQRELAWDCGAGSGQATAALAARFNRVVGTDISAAQLGHAHSLPNVEYRVAPAEHSGLADRSVDLVTVAQALHWFDLPSFYAEVRRVLKPHGVVAAWCYSRLQIDHPVIQRIFDRFRDQTVGPYWPPEVVHTQNGYRDLPFPFRRITPPRFRLREEWSREHLLGYVQSWSSVARFRAANNYDPVDALAGELAACWPEGRAHRVDWPLFVQVGRAE